MTSTRRLAFALVSLAVLASGGVAQADPQTEARAHFRAARRELEGWSKEALIDHLLRLEAVQ